MPAEPALERAFALSLHPAGAPGQRAGRGAYYTTLALGLSLIFGLGGVVNLAHGAFYALGAYFALEAQRLAGFGGAIVLSPFVVALIGMAIETAFLRRLYRGDPLLGLLFTFGLAMVSEQMVRIL